MNLTDKELNPDEHIICSTCGTQYKTHKQEICFICSDERQYIPEQGQAWTTHQQLLQKHNVEVLKLQDNLFQFTVSPAIGIGQRALLLLSPEGNILWDCIPLLDDIVTEFIRSKGGLKAIAFSHPHFFSNMSQWADKFDCPVYINAKDKNWIFNKGNHITLWEGEQKHLWDDICITNLGGHFPGSSILHARQSSPGGMILSGDTVLVSADKKHISIMYSYPNRIPLPIKDANRIMSKLKTLEFDSLYSAFPNLGITKNVKEILSASIARYI
ncbi:MBL fold metallo-hydrolase [Flavitalea sp.]|nr:hypothetical protein [Flavitalea sp.]